MIEKLLDIETAILGLVTWPSWALRTIVVLCFLIAAVSLVQAIGIENFYARETFECCD